MTTQENTHTSQDLAEVGRMCKDAFYGTRDSGGTMHTAADDAAAAILGSTWLREFVHRQVTEYAMREKPVIRVETLDGLPNADRLLRRERATAWDEGAHAGRVYQQRLHEWAQQRSAIGVGPDPVLNPYRDDDRQDRIKLDPGQIWPTAAQLIAHHEARGEFLEGGGTDG